MKYVLEKVESYFLDTEEEVNELIQAAKDDGEFELKKYTSEFKQKKVKGEVVAEYYKCVLTKKYNDEKDLTDY